MATQWAGKYSSRTLVELNNATFFQAEASDQWSYYQAKSIKQNLYEALPEVAPKDPGAGAANGAAGFAAKVTKYGKEKEEIREKAEALEKKRDASRDAASQASQHGGAMGTAVSVFQIAIALGSISIVTKKRALWYIALIFAALATIQMIYVRLT